MNSYTVEPGRTLAGLRYYIRRNGKRIPSGFGNKTAALERVKFLQVVEQAQEELNAQIKAVRQERSI